MRCCETERSSHRPKPTKQEAETSSQEERRPREGADDGVDCVAGALWPTAISTEPRCTQLTPSSAERARRERRHPKASKAKKSLALDPLENAIRRFETLTRRKWHLGAYRFDGGPRPIPGRASRSPLAEKGPAEGRRRGVGAVIAKKVGAALGPPLLLRDYCDGRHGVLWRVLLKVASVAKNAFGSSI